ncbi:hypothetical protein HQ394_08865 [Defluviicoccus vanus]|uniref:Glycosyl hydrolase family 71 n=2 Tax=Defluviicoccus vanus TaxID=111831 RepID=A0A7H1N125_9PROT|nr:hypothetical protein HQ394_08865 [Defluviicoccus vanus]
MPYIVAILAIFCAFTRPSFADAPILPLLPFDRPSLTTLQASDHKACAVWHVWRTSMDNKDPASDQFTLQQMSPTGNNGLYYGSGGRMRQRPLPRPVSSDPQWKIRDMEDDVDRASAIGLDCFFLSLCTISNGSVCWDEFRDLLVAANNRNNGFKIVPMMDVASLMNAGKTGAEIASALASIANNPALMRDKNGHIYIGATNGDLAPLSWWQAIKSNLLQRGIEASYVLTVQAYVKSKPTYMPFADGYGNMGAGTPLSVTDASDRVAELHQLGKIHVTSIKPQDFRPSKFWYLEPNNSVLLRSVLTNAISSGSDWLLFNSWNDRTESHELAPSTGTQYALYDVAAYYITWFKTGSPPPIVRDVLYYFHRIMWTTTPFDPTKQTMAFFRHPSEDKQQPVNEIELLAFLTAPGKLQISLGGKATPQDALAGITSFRIPLAAGKPTFKLIRNGLTKIKLTSAFQIRNTTTWQDLLYRGGGSTRPVVDMVANPPVTQ